MIEILHYIMHEKSSEKTYPNGIRDQGRKSVSLAYFLTHRKAQVVYSLPNKLEHLSCAHGFACFIAATFRKKVAGFWG
jgi:hypothetical protein